MPTTKQTAAELLGKYAELVNKFGIDSADAKSFLEANKACELFTSLVPTVHFIRNRIDRYAGSEPRSPAR